MNRFLQRICLALAAATLVLAIGAGAAEPQIDWNLTFGEPDWNETAYSLVQGPGGTFVFAGTAETPATNTTDALVVNLTADGEVIWNLTRGSLGEDVARSVINTSENATLFGGGFMYITNETRRDTDAWLMRFNGTGSDDLNETYGSPDVNASAHAIIETADGDYLFAGSIEPFGTGMTDAWVVQVNRTGGLVWEARIGLPEANESAKAVIETADGNYLFAGCTDAAGEGDTDAWLVMLNSTGTELWNRTYGGQYDDCAFALIQTSDGSYVIGGNFTYVTGTDRPDNDAWVVKVDDAGNEIWNMTYGCSSVNATAYALLETPDDGVLFAGDLELYGTGDYDALLVKLDDEGRDVWEGIFGSVNVDRAYAVVSPEEDCYVFAGVFNATNGTAAVSSDAWVSRVCIPPEPVPPPTPDLSRASVGDLVWNDANGNGIQDAGEAGVPGVKVCLYNRCKCCIATTRTGADGRYAFTNLEPGTYSLRFLLPRTAIFTLPNQGTDDAADSDADPVTGRTARFTLAPGANDLTRDAGLVRIDTIGLDLEKLTNGEDADTPPGPSVTVGENVTWTYNVTNTGRVPLFGLNVTDDRLGIINVTNPAGDANENGILDPAENWTFMVNGTAVAGQYANVANATASFTTCRFRDGDRSHYTGIPAEQPVAAVEIEKSTNGEDADEPPGPAIPVGENVTWTYNITNTGEVALENVTVTDSREGAIDETRLVDNGDGDAVLAAGEYWIFRLNGTAAAGPYENIANVTADLVGRDGNVTGSDMSHYNGTGGDLVANISIEKWTASDWRSGDNLNLPIDAKVSWEYYVTNTGDTPITQISIIDDKEGDVIAKGAPDVDYANMTLNPGETWEFRLEGTAVEGIYENTATVTGTDSFGRMVSASDASGYSGNNLTTAMDLELYTNGEDADEPPGPEIPVGEEVTWRITLTNNAWANISLWWSYITFNGEKSELPVYFLSGDNNNDGDLNPGEIWIFELNSTAVEGRNEMRVSQEGWLGYRWWDQLHVMDSDYSYYTGVLPTTPEPVETETPEPVETETPEPIETETPEPVETETPEPVENETPEPVETETPPAPPEPVEPERLTVTQGMQAVIPEPVLSALVELSGML